MESSELRNQRLKEVFQRKIQEFRTVCYILTGYQIDITTENQYRLTSVYAEHMEDSLLFKKVGDNDFQWWLFHLLTNSRSKKLHQYNYNGFTLSDFFSLLINTEFTFAHLHTSHKWPLGHTHFFLPLCVLPWLLLLLAPTCEVKRNVVSIEMAQGRPSVDVWQNAPGSANLTLWGVHPIMLQLPLAPHPLLFQYHPPVSYLMLMHHDSSYSAVVVKPLEMCRPSNTFCPLSNNLATTLSESNSQFL